MAVAGRTMPVDMKKLRHPRHGRTTVRLYAALATASWGLVSHLGTALAQDAAPPIVTSLGSPLTVESCPKPVYPNAARRAEVEGTTTVRIKVGPQGRVTEADVVKSAGDTRIHKYLDKVVRDAVLGCKFNADGPGERISQLSFTFSLDEQTPAASGASAAADGEIPPAALAHWRAAHERASTGDRAGAVTELDAVLALTPNAPEVFLARGEFHLGLMHWAQALSDMSRAIELYGRSQEAVPALVYRSQLLWPAQRGKARADIDLAIQLDPKAPEAYFMLANMQRTDGQFENALQSIERCLLLKPKESRYRQTKGTVLADLGRLDASVIEHGAAIELDPTNPFAWASRALAELELQRFDKARDDARRAVSLFPGHGNSRLIEAMALVFLGDVRAAGAILVDLSRTSPGVLDEPTMVPNASTQALLGRMTSDARSAPRAHLALAMLNAAGGKTSEAQRHFADAERADSSIASLVAQARQALSVK